MCEYHLLRWKQICCSRCFFSLPSFSTIFSDRYVRYPLIWVPSLHPIKEKSLTQYPENITRSITRILLLSIMTIIKTNVRQWSAIFLYQKILNFLAKKMLAMAKPWFEMCFSSWVMLFWQHYQFQWTSKIKLYKL